MIEKNFKIFINRIWKHFFCKNLLKACRKLETDKIIFNIFHFYRTVNFEIIIQIKSRSESLIWYSQPSSFPSLSTSFYHTSEQSLFIFLLDSHIISLVSHCSVIFTLWDKFTMLKCRQLRQKVWSDWNRKGGWFFKFISIGLYLYDFSPYTFTWSFSANMLHCSHFHSFVTYSSTRFGTQTSFSFWHWI